MLTYSFFFLGDLIFAENKTTSAQAIAAVIDIDKLLLIYVLMNGSSHSPKNLRKLLRHVVRDGLHVAGDTGRQNFF